MPEFYIKSMDKQNSEAKLLASHKSSNRLLIALLLLASILFLVGISTPMMTISKFIWFENSFSILAGVGQLFVQGQYLLFLLISAFSILLPILKIIILFQILLSSNNHSERQNKNLHLMHEYGRWAMLDVMVVAVLIVTVKLGVLASVKVHFGLYVFTAAVLIIMFITHRVVQSNTLNNNANL